MGRRIVAGAIDKWQRSVGKRSETKKMMDPKRQEIVSQVTLTAEQQKDIDRFFLVHYGEKIPYDWHRLYTAFTGNFCVEYFPELLYIPVLERKLNPATYIRAFSDKSMLSRLFFGIEGSRIPKIFISNTNGIYSNSQEVFISKQKACDLLYNAGEVVIKPTIDSNSGKNVRFYRISGNHCEDTNQNISEILDSYQKDFVVQEAICQHRILCDLFPNSVNTFRVMTYIHNGNVEVCPVTLRLGQGNSRVDNAHAGGMFIGVQDGKLRSQAFTEFKTVYERHPDTKVVFEGYEIPWYDKILSVAKKMHMRIPRLGILSFDFAIDDAGNVAIIEINTYGQTVWFPQEANGAPLFGEHTGDMLKLIAKK